MALTPEQINKINGPESYEGLLAARKRNKQRQPAPERVVEGLQDAAMNGVVDPDSSLAIHNTGEVPVIDTDKKSGNI